MLKVDIALMVKNITAPLRVVGGGRSQEMLMQLAVIICTDRFAGAALGAGDMRSEHGGVYLHPSQQWS